MNVLIINFSLRPESSKKLFPVGLGYIATAIKNAGYDFDIIDFNANREATLEFSKEYDVVCIGTLVSGYKRTKEILKTVRQNNPKAKIIVGNSVATSIPYMLLQNTEADIAVMGEGDETIVELLRSIESKSPLNEILGIVYKDGEIIHRTLSRPAIKEISSIPNIDFDLFDIEGYIINGNVHESKELADINIRSIPINTARGCIANCTFCYHVFKEFKYRYRTPRSIIDEIKYLIPKYNINYVRFYDELTFFSKKHTESFVNEMLQSGIRVYWAVQCRANLFKKDDLYLAQKMKEAGCCGVFYSLESSDANILRAMNKHISVENFSEQTRVLQSAGLPTWTSLVFGYPQETPETIMNTFQCCIESNIYPSIGFLLPQPGSPMYKYALDNGYVTDEEEYIMNMGDRQDLTINMTQMSDEEFIECIWEGAKKCNRELNVGLDEDSLIKTTFYRTAK